MLYIFSFIVCPSIPECVKNPCSICKFRVHNNHKAILCNICHLWTQLKCTLLSLSEYNDLTHSHDDWVQGPQIWNDIHLSLRNSLTVSSYKHKLRDYFQSL